MIKLTEYDFASIEEVDVKAVLSALQDWEQELSDTKEDEIVQYVLDSVQDIIIENCTFTIYN